MKKRFIVILLALLVGSAGAVFGAIFDGGADGTGTSFNVGENWNPDGMLASGDYIIGGGHDVVTTEASMADTGGWEVLVGYLGNGNASLTINAGHTIQSNQDLEVGVGSTVGAPYGVVDIYGTWLGNGGDSRVQVGDKKTASPPRDGTGVIYVHDGGSIAANDDFWIYSGSIHYAAHAIQVANHPVIKYYVDPSGTVGFETDGTTVPTVACSTATLQLYAGSTLEIDLTGAFDNNQTWILFTGVNSTNVENSFTNVLSSQGYTFTQNYDAGADTFSITLTDANTLPVLPASSRDVAVDTMLEWKDNGFDANTVGYDVYISTNADMSAATQLVTDQLVYTASPTLVKDTTYFWRVDAYEYDVNIDDIVLETGAVWTFSTEATPPSITGQPADILDGEVGDGVPFVAVFTVTTANATSWQWFQVVVDGDDIALADGADVIGATTEELTVAISASGTTEYYCVIGGGTATAPAAPLTSNTATLTVTIADPVVLSDPTGVTVAGDGTESAVFIMTGDNVEAYKWYRQGDIDALVNGGRISGADTGTLTIANAVQADEGVYYCNIGTIGSEPVETATAVLMTERLVGHWDFNHNLNDSESALVGEYYNPDTDTVISPAYVTDGTYADGGTITAIQLDNDANHVQIPGTEDLYNFYVNGVTVSAWIKTDADLAFPAVVSNTQLDGQNGIVLRASEGASFKVDGATDDVVSHDPNNIDGQWHMLTGTFDGQNVKIYVDGHIGEVSELNENVISGSLEILLFGVSRSDGTSPFEGLIDDIEIYSYALDHDTIAQKYADISGKVACKSNPEADLNGDCFVNLEDLALLASQWMHECRVVPTN